MTYSFGETEYELPDTLADITVATVRAWSAAYGHALNLAGIAAEQAPNEEVGKLRRTLLFMDQITHGLSYFSTPAIDVDIVRNSMDLAQVTELIATSGVNLAIQGPHTPIPEYPLTRPATVVIAGDSFTVYSPLESVVMETLTHEQFLCMLQLGQYMSEMADGDWTNFHNLCAGFIRTDGQALTLALITPEGARAAFFLANMKMDIGAPLAQMFVDEASGVLQVLDGYTTQVLTPSGP